MLIFRTFSEYRHSFFAQKKGENYGMKKTDEMCSLHGNYPGVDVIQVKLEDLHAFKNHPFKVEKDQALFELRQSIESEGILVPLLVRKSCDGAGYEIVSGHRRKEAALWVGLERVPVIVKELSDDQAIIAMVDSNLHREKILPSEKAFAYKMRLEAMKHQGKEITLDLIGPKPEENGLQIYPLKVEQGEFGEMVIAPTEKKISTRSNEMLARMVGESVTQIKRYIRLTYLIPKLLEIRFIGTVRRRYPNHRSYGTGGDDPWNPIDRSCDRWTWDGILFIPGKGNPENERTGICTESGCNQPSGRCTQKIRECQL